MKAVLPALLYALFVWWFSTGLVLLVVLRRQWVRASLVGAAALFPVCLYALAVTSKTTGVASAYAAFTAAIVLWGTQEVAFLTGFLTGPRPLACPPGAVGRKRAQCAIGAILYHEIALVVSGLAILIVTWAQPNQVGSLTFLVLWIMRVSAKLNLFLGVPVLNDEVLPERIAYLRSYFLKGPVNRLFPVAVLLSILLAGFFVGTAADPAASASLVTRAVLLATLTILAIVEHVFMLVPLPVDRLWRWASWGGRPSETDRSRIDPLPRCAEVDVDRAVPFGP